MIGSLAVWAIIEVDSKEAALKYLIFPCGVLRGALYSLGVTAVVNDEKTAKGPLQRSVQS